MACLSSIRVGVRQGSFWLEFCHRPYTTLSLPAQLNVDADHLAGSYVPHPTINPTIVTMIAGSAVSLHLLSGTITTKYRNALCKAASVDSIQHYIQTKHKWSNDEFALINWTTHGHSVRRVYHKKQFIVKFVHEWLPLGRLTSKYKKHIIYEINHFTLPGTQNTNKNLPKRVLIA